MSFSSKLTTWMNRKGLSDSGLGKLLSPKVTRQSVMDWRNGRYLPSDQHRGTIIELSGEFITAEDFIIKRKD
jgi:hypothetical protein